jgi:O-antigen/teichoic acid export membrane protein
LSNSVIYWQKSPGITAPPEVISKTFIKSSIIYTVAGTLPMASAVILLPFYIHYLSTEAFGAFSILLALSLLVQIIATFSFDTSVYVHFHEYKNDPKKLSAFISSAFLFIAVAGAGIAVVLILTGDLIAGLVSGHGTLSFYPYGLISVFTGIFQAFFKVYNSLLQTQQKPTLFFRSNLLSFSLIAGGTVAGLYLEPNSLIGPMGARLISAVVCGGWSFFRVAREFGIRLDYALLRSSFSFNFYSFIYQLQQWLMNYFDRILLSFFLPLSDVGVYGFLTSCLVVIEFILNGLYNSFSPKIVGMVIDQKEKGSTTELNRYYNGLTAVSMMLVSGSILTFPLLIEAFVTKPSYQQAIVFIPYAILIYLFKPMRLYLSIPYGILKYTKSLPVIYMVVAALKIMLLALVISHFNIYGVIFTSLLTFWLEMLLLYNNGKKRFKFTFNTYKLLLAPVVLMAIILVAEPVAGIHFPLYTHFVYVAVCLIMLTWIFRNEVRQVIPWKMLKHK